MYGWTSEFHMVVNKDIVMVDGHDCGTSQVAAVIEPGSCKRNVIGLPFTGAAGCIDTRRKLSVKRCRHPICIGSIIVAVEDLNFVFSHQEYTAVAALLALS